MGPSVWPVLHEFRVQVAKTGDTLPQEIILHIDRGDIHEGLFRVMVAVENCLVISLHRAPGMINCTLAPGHPMNDDHVFVRSIRNTHRDDLEFFWNVLLQLDISPQVWLLRAGEIDPVLMVAFDVDEFRFWKHLLDRLQNDPVQFLMILFDRPSIQVPRLVACPIGKRRILMGIPSQDNDIRLEVMQELKHWIEWNVKGNVDVK